MIIKTDYIINKYTDKPSKETNWRMVRTPGGSYRNVPGNKNFLRRGVDVTKYAHFDLNTPYLIKFYDDDSTDYLVVEFNRIEQTDNGRVAYFREIRVDSEPLDNGVYSDYIKTTLHKGYYESGDHALTLLPITNIKNLEYDKVATRYRKPERDLKDLPSNNIIPGPTENVDPDKAFASELLISDIKKLKETTTFLIFKNTGNGVELVSEDSNSISLDRDKIEDIRKASNRADRKKIDFDDLINHTDDILVARDIVNIAEDGRNPYTFFRVIDREGDSYNIEIYDSLSKQIANSWPEDSFVAYPGDRVEKTSKLSINENNTMYTNVGEVYKIEGISSYFESLSLWDDIPRYYTITKYTYN